MKLTIKRDEWDRGSTGRFYNRDTGSCVIGHYLLACGISKENLKGWGDAGELLTHLHWTTPQEVNMMTDTDNPLSFIVQSNSDLYAIDEADNEEFWTTDAASEAIEINDESEQKITNAERETQLIDLLAGWGTELRFV